MIRWTRPPDGGLVSKSGLFQIWNIGEDTFTLTIYGMTTHGYYETVDKAKDAAEAILESAKEEMEEKK